MTLFRNLTGRIETRCREVGEQYSALSLFTEIARDKSKKKKKKKKKRKRHAWPKVAFLFFFFFFFFFFVVVVLGFVIITMNNVREREELFCKPMTFNT